MCVCVYIYIFFFFFFLAVQLEESWFPDQGLNLGPTLVKVQSPNTGLPGNSLNYNLMLSLLIQGPIYLVPNSKLCPEF